MDRQQFASMVMEREKTLYKIARSMLFDAADQQDAVQEAITKAWAKRNTLREAQYFSSWLVRILINECNSIYRKQSRFVFRASWEENSLGAVPPENDADLDAAMDRLPERLRLVVVLHYIEGFKLNEIAGMLHCTQGAVKKRLFDARKMLKLSIEQDKEAYQ